MLHFFAQAGRLCHDTGPQRVHTHQIDVVGENHEIAGAEFPVDAARRVRQQQIADSQCRQRADGKRATRSIECPCK